MITLAFYWCFPADMTPEEGLPRLAASGFEAVELWPEALARFGARRWAAALTANRMACAQLCPYFDFVRGNHVLASSLAQLAGYLAACDTLDCRRLRVFTGPPWGDETVGAAQASPAQWAVAGEHLARFCDFAAPFKVELCLECHGGSLMEDSPSTKRLLDLVDRRNLTVNLQFPLEGETWEVSAERLGPYTTHHHVHDYESATGHGPMTFLGQGAFPIAAALTRVAAYGRDLTWSIEHADHGGCHDPWEAARRDGPWLAALRNRIKAG